MLVLPKRPLWACLAKKKPWWHGQLLRQKKNAKNISFSDAKGLRALSAFCQMKEKCTLILWEMHLGLVSHGIFKGALGGISVKRV